MNHTTRRRFLVRASSATLGLSALRTSVKSEETVKRLRHAAIGGGGQGASDLRDFMSHPRMQLKAVADVNLEVLDAIKRIYPECRVYQDWRELRDKEMDQIDSVSVSTPDHMHASVAAAFMTQGKHAYVQKPLAQTVLETRHLAQLAEKHQLVTQMGTQIASTLANTRVVELIHAGAIGKIKSAYLWSTKSWGDDQKVPQREDSVPEGLDWDGWLGVADERPFVAGAYHPEQWRKRIDFGTGTLGDMGCHIFHPVFAALQLTAPISVTSNGPKPNADSWATSSSLDYIFPGNEMTAGDTVDFHWYDGAIPVPAEIYEQLGKALQSRIPEQGSIVLGTKGLLLCPHVGLPILAPFETMGRTEHPNQELRTHYHEFIEAALGEKAQLRSEFEYAARLTESVLLGCLASHFPGQKLDWDATKMRFTNQPEADAFVTRTYRSGWELSGLPERG